MADWSSLVASCRSAREQKNISAEEFKTRFLVHLPALSAVVSEYSSKILLASLSDNDKSSPTSGVSASQTLAVRRAIRFGLSSLSFGQCEGDGMIRRAVQNEAVVVCGLHKSLAILLSRDGVDTKCRLSAAKLLCNLVTANTNSAAIVANDIALSPCESLKAKRLLDRLASDRSSREDCNVGAERANWVDMISAAARAGERNSVAALVAALHNMLSSFDSQVDFRKETEKRELEYAKLASSVASDKSLVCSLVRNILPVEAVNSGGRNHTQSGGETNNSNDTPQMDVSDEVTEWVSLLLEKLGADGLLLELYESLGTSSDNGSRSADFEEFVTPEHVVLLHCIGRAVHEAMHQPREGRIPSSDPLGKNQSTYLKTLLFLAGKAELLRNLSKDGEKQKYEGEQDCRHSAFMCILEMIATTLAGYDRTEEDMRKIPRISIGRDCGLFAACLEDLAFMVDKSSQATGGSKAKELVLTNKEQRLIVVLVRLLGNLCFECKNNQDLLRITEIPIMFSNVSVIKNDAHNSGEETCTGQDSSKDVETPLRTGLHVLLSCTSLSYRCFTLREWAVVAIRNTLDDNIENQSLVASLESQKALNTPELEKMGFHIGLNANGQVTVEQASTVQSNMST